MAQKHVAIVGGGIFGLAHAWSAAERGWSVSIFERDRAASSASIRNFGMVWPIGQTLETIDLALVSRRRWLSMAESAGVWANPCGSIHLAHRDDEWEVLQEFAAHVSKIDQYRDCRLMNPTEASQISLAANPDGLKGGFFSPMELCVDPVTAIRSIPKWLEEKFGVQTYFNSTVIDIDDSELTIANGERHSFDRAVVCSGADAATLAPDIFGQSPLIRCRLQMLRTVRQPAGWRIGPHIASGLTLRHYKSFRVCSSLQKLIDRVATESPELDRFGIHVMSSQNHLGEVVLGDSHEYEDDIEPFDKEVIDDLILSELEKIIRLPDWGITSRWHGIYSKNPHDVFFEDQIHPNVTIQTGLGGAGMTLSFGIAEQSWNKWGS